MLQTMKPLAYAHEGDREGIQNPWPSLDGVVGAICSAMAASGAVLAVCDSEGIRCIASAGDAPDVGSRVQGDATFTRECIETGEVTLCEDAETDSRIRPSVAQSLNLRSAVAVPIQAGGSVVGLIEIFSSRPSGIYATDIAVLKQFAEFFAPMITSKAVSSVPTMKLNWARLLSQREDPSSAGEQRQSPKSIRAKQRSLEPQGSSESNADSQPSSLTGAFARDASLAKSQGPKERPMTLRGQLTGALAHVVLPFAGKSAAAGMWRQRAASLALLAVSLFFSLFFLLSGSFPIKSH